MINPKKYSRFFAFGCSMTDYWWPTWADIIAYDCNESYNFGKSGAGNLYISLQIVEANQRFRFTKHDLIMVMWSSTTREDRYVKHTWHTPGNIYSQDYYNEEFIKKYSDVRGYLIRDLGLISLTDKFLESIGCDYHMMSMSPFVSEPSRYFDFCKKDPKKDLDDVTELYKPLLKKIKPDLLTVGCNGKWPQVNIYHNENQTMDYHPTPETHYNYLRNVFPGIQLSIDAVYWAMEHETIIRNAKNASELNPESWKARFKKFEIL